MVMSREKARLNPEAAESLIEPGPFCLIEPGPFCFLLLLLAFALLFCWPLLLLSMLRKDCCAPAIA